MKKIMTSLAAAVLLLTPAATLAGSLTIPNTFSSGSPAVAAEVNDNFTAVKTEVDDNNSRVTANEGDIAAIALSVSSYPARIASLEAAIATLQSTISSLASLLPLASHVTVDSATTLDGLAAPHVIFTGANIHVQNGSGQSGTANGLGNLIVGYNEAGRIDSSQRTGSHNLVVGSSHRYTSYGGLVGGFANVVTGPYGSVTGGTSNEAAGVNASVTGGYGNVARGDYAAVSGGSNNTASGLYASVNGGYENTASGMYATISGGTGITADLDNAIDSPSYDSGWFTVTAGSEKELFHNLGGNVDDYVYKLDFRPIDGIQGDLGYINNIGIGGFSTWDSMNLNTFRGGYLRRLTPAYFRVGKMLDDSDIYQMRFRIWVKM